MFIIIMSIFVNGQLVNTPTEIGPYEDFQTCNSVAAGYRAESYPGYGVVALCKPVRK